MIIIPSSEYLDPSFSNKNGMFKLGGSAVVRTDCCPTIFQDLDLWTSFTDSRLDGEGHSWQHHSRVGVPGRKYESSLVDFLYFLPAWVNIWRTMKIVSYAMTSEGRNHFVSTTIYIFLDCSSWKLLYEKFVYRMVVVFVTPSTSAENSIRIISRAFQQGFPL